MKKFKSKSSLKYHIIEIILFKVDILNSMESNI